MELPSVYRLVHLTVRISVHLNSSYTGSDVEEDLKNTENGTLDEYNRIAAAVSDPDYAAKEQGAVRNHRLQPGGTAAWPQDRSQGS